MSALARSWIQPVASVSAGPPLGGSYLKPPSAGGLCDGVTTMPSASALVRPRLWPRIACETAGVGVHSSSPAIIVSTPFAARTSSALANAGADSACVSMPTNSGPVVPWRARYSQIACVMARMCHSLKARSNEEPRCPEVPKLTRSAATAGSGRSVK